MYSLKRLTLNLTCPDENQIVNIDIFLKILTCPSGQVKWEIYLFGNKMLLSRTSVEIFTGSHLGWNEHSIAAIDLCTEISDSKDNNAETIAYNVTH